MFFSSEKTKFRKIIANITNNYKNRFFILLWNLRFKNIFSWKLHCFLRFQKSLIFNFFSIKTYFCWWKKWVFVKKGCNRLRPSANKNPRIVFRKNNHQICDHLEPFFVRKIVKIQIFWHFLLLCDHQHVQHIQDQFTFTDPHDLLQFVTSEDKFCYKNLKIIQKSNIFGSTNKRKCCVCFCQKHSGLAVIG